MYSGALSSAFEGISIVDRCAHAHSIADVCQILLNSVPFTYCPKIQYTCTLYEIKLNKRILNKLECQLDLLDKVVVPVLLYGSEVWGFENFDLIERLHLTFLKYV